MSGAALAHDDSRMLSAFASALLDCRYNDMSGSGDPRSEDIRTDVALMLHPEGPRPDGPEDRALPACRGHAHGNDREARAQEVPPFLHPLFGQANGKDLARDVGLVAHALLAEIQHPRDRCLLLNGDRSLSVTDDLDDAGAFPDAAPECVEGRCVAPQRPDRTVVADGVGRGVPLQTALLPGVSHHDPTVLYGQRAFGPEA